jgi:hypothetical protein
LSWLEGQGLDPELFAVALGTMCTCLADFAMLTQGDVAMLSQLKAMEKRRLIVALSSLPGSAVGSVARPSTAAAADQVTVPRSMGQLEEALAQQLERGDSERIPPPQ